MSIWKIYDYDVLGNPHEGFEINDRFYVGEVKIPNPSDPNSIRAIVADCTFETQLEIDDSHEKVIFIEHASTGKPLFELVYDSYQDEDTNPQEHNT